MSTKQQPMMKELKMKKGYGEVMYLMRIANVPEDTIGYKLLQISIMSYLQNPNLHKKQLVQIAFANSPMILLNEKICFRLMKDALQNLYTKHLEKLDDDNVVFKFIFNVASEVRLRELIKIRVEEEKLTGVNKHISSVFCRVCIRRIMNPNDTFMEVLNHCAGRCAYDDVDDLIIDLYKVVKNNDIETKILLFNNQRIQVAKKQQIAKEIVLEVEQLVLLFIREHNNIVF